MKKGLLMTILTLGLVLSFTMNYVLADVETSKVIDATIYNGPSQQISTANRSANSMKIKVNRYVTSGTFTSFSFRGYYGTAKVTDLLSFSGTGTVTKTYKTVSGFQTGSIVRLMGSVPQDANTYCRVTCGFQWFY